jgi:hypothetical protein
MIVRRNGWLMDRRKGGREQGRERKKKTRPREKEDTHHEHLEIRPPPLLKTVSNLPVSVFLFTGNCKSSDGLGSDGGETLVEASLEPGVFVFAGLEVVAGTGMRASMMKVSNRYMRRYERVRGSTFIRTG